MSDQFVKRHIGTSTPEQEKMLASLGYTSLDDLIEAAVPESILDTVPLALPPALTEQQAQAKLRSLADQNQIVDSFIGMGWNDCFTPPVIRRNMVENPAWYTAYTPYQPEISQGRLEMILTFQTLVSDLTGCDIANASMLDEATAAAEAMTMIRRNYKGEQTTFFVDEGVHPQTLAVVQTRSQPLGIELVVGSPAQDLDPSSIFGALFASPTTTGQIQDISPWVEQCKEHGILTAATTDLLACCIVTPPGEQGADIVVGSAQRFGVPMGFGGPHAGFIATNKKFARSLPGRLVGVSIDSSGKPAYRLALQTREQHIRREKATSNICTAQVLLANVSAAYAAWHGPDGLIEIAKRTHWLAQAASQQIDSLGLTTSSEFFDTFVVTATGQATRFVEQFAEGIDEGPRMNMRLVDEDHIGISFDETTTVDHVEAITRGFAKVLGQTVDVKALASLRSGQLNNGHASTEIQPEMQRQTSFLTHENFNSYHTEAEMTRWLRRLSDKDLALDRTMIPLGSCTMKLNAAAEMEPISWPEFASIHPFSPQSQTTGYRQLIAELEDDLAEITGYAKVSLQPNAGSQGEYAGLLAIRAFHKHNGDSHRTICLVPSSAHGTNAASAVMAGLQVVVVACDDDGNIDVTDLAAKIETHGDDLAALMITYPSTHGVYEETVSQVCDMVHAAGGQVYTDGANLNALVGVAKPGQFGSDVSHLNLHKTFCIPHGGGGPGVGPVAVAEHLAPFLPSHPVITTGTDQGPAISGAPYGSAGILPISWMYIRMMGPSGLKAATAAAVLAANYIAYQLKNHYPVLYTGHDGLVAHECIIDIRDITKLSGITNDDIAKRLVDYGYHAPTMSFPVNGTLMIEPTESESPAELNRFCTAMISIREEIQEVIDGRVSAEDSVLRHAPHTAELLVADEWDRMYSRETAAYPVSSLRTNKYFPPVGRIDNAHGDRNLSCTCPPLSAYS